MRLFVDQLTNLDFSYLDEKRGLVGETWLANIELEGELDEQGMVCDFGDVKKTMRHWLDTTIDHKLLIPMKSAALSFESENDIDRFDWRSGRGLIRSAAPTQAHCLVEASEINRESVAAWAIAQLKQLFPDSIRKLSLSFSLEQIDGPYYHYSHGLKKHGGNCQRIAHGHRSRIDIWKNEAPSLDLMSEWASKWADIYVGSEEDCQADPEIANNLLFHYHAQQGEFSLSLPREHCYLMPTETTVEHIASHLLEVIKTRYPGELIKVKAFEGIAKGAIAEQ